MRPLFLAATLLSLAAQEYTFQTFSVQGNPTRVYSLNNRGATVGHYWNGTASVGFKRHAGGAIEVIRVPELEYDSLLLYGINNYGEIIGTAYLRNGYSFKLGAGSPRSYTPLNYRSGGDPFATTAVYGINSTDTVVGRVTDIGGFIQTGGNFSFIEFPGTSSFDTTPRGIAADGTVVGCFETSRTSPFLRGPRGNFLEMIIPGAQGACALAISNPAGKIVGEFQDTSGVWHGFVYDYVSDLARTVVGVPTARTVRVQVVDYPGATRTQLSGINGEGKIVGWANLNNGRTVSFIGTARP